MSYTLPAMESIPLEKHSKLLDSLRRNFQGMRVWDYFSISKFKKSMFCPSYLFYLSKGHRERKIKFPEAIRGTQIHDILDVTKKEQAPPVKAASNNILGLYKYFTDSMYEEKESVLTELPYFSPFRKMYGYPDVLLFHSNGSLSVDIIERKTRMKQITSDGLPNVYADDMYQLLVQKNIVKDILQFCIQEQGLDLRLEDVDIETFVEIRVRYLDYERPTEEEYTSEAVNAIQSLDESGKKKFMDNYIGKYEMPVLFNEPSLTQEPLYCKVDVGNELMEKRFDYVANTLFSQSGFEINPDCVCHPKKRKYCGYSHLCMKAKKQSRLGRFIRWG